MTSIAGQRASTRGLSIALVVLLIGCEPTTVTTIPPRAPASPTATPTAAPPQVGGPVGPNRPSSLGEATLLHLQFASHIDPVSGVPQALGDTFASGTTQIVALLAWEQAPVGTEFRLRLYDQTKFLYEAKHEVVLEERDATGEHVGIPFGMRWEGGFPDGTYTAELAYNGVVDEVTSFTVGGAGLSGVVTGTGIQSGPILYADPSEVLIVTRRDVLERNLGARAAEVFAAADLVGRVVDLGAAGVPADSPTAAAAAIAPLLRAGGYRYLLILGNHDAVPFFMLDNPLERSDASALEGWGLPADIYPSDDPYTDLDRDAYGVPDIAIARIPSSEDADLLLTQLTERMPPDGSAYALVNQGRRSQAGAVIATINPGIAVEAAYSPPVDAARFNQSNAGNARYLYVLLHGIGVDADEWSADTVVWRDLGATSGEWQVNSSTQLPAVRIENNPGSRGVVEVGACYGAWTLDTEGGPNGSTHKTADNSLALHYLKSGTRSFIADTHISYSFAMAPGNLPIGRTGFETVFWQAINARQTPIDAFQTAKVAMAETIDILKANELALLVDTNIKTLHYMIYLGRP